MVKKHFRLRSKLLAAFLCVLLVLPALPASAKTIDEVQAQQAQLQQETEALKSKLSELENDEAKAQEYSDTLAEQIDATQHKIDTTRQNIEILNQNIVSLEEKLKDSQDEYSGTMEKLKERIKVLYKAGEVGTIEMLLSSTSLYEFSMRTEMLKSATAHDKQLMDAISAYMTEVKADRELLEKQKKEVAELQKTLEADQEDLAAAQDANTQVISQLQTARAGTQQQITANEEEDEALNNEIINLIAQKKAEDEAALQAAAEEAARKAEEEAKRAEEEANQPEDGSTDDGSSDDGDGSESGSDGSGDNSGSDDEGEDNNVYVPPTAGGDGSLSAQWPLPGYSINDLTQSYGNNGHMGMDIGVPYGSPITAVEAGQVLSASYHWSWGNNVLIYHNGTYSTRYAHMSSMAVSTGEYVSKGQVIGYVGNTGNSFGNHLHLEVYLDGYRVDPYPYLTSLS